MSEILVLAEQRRGELRPVSLELVTAAQALRRSAEDRVSVGIIGSQPQAFVPPLSVSGVDAIVSCEIPNGEFEPDTWLACTQALIAARRPSIVMLAHSIDSFGFAAELAVQGNYGFATDVFKLGYDADQLVATRGGYGQKVNVEVDFPGKSVTVLCIRGSVFKPAEGQAKPLVNAVAAPSFTSRSKNLKYIDATSADDVDMTKAEFIVSIGRGIGEQSKVAGFIDLAEVLGATLGCSRPVADSGWLPKSRQVGQSGKTASACKLYVAMGISGAIQHLAGMKHVPTIVAVNSDGNASIFTVATYGIVGDVFEVAEALRAHF